MLNSDCFYCCPVTHKPLRREAGKFVSSSGDCYYIEEGIPDFTYPQELTGICLDQKRYYDQAADDYDRVAHLTFTIQNEDETAVRQRFVDLLRLSPEDRVLEISCGTGRDSVIIADRLGSSGKLHLQDISKKMLLQAVAKLRSARVPVDACAGNACYLPFPDRHFDAAYSFGGLSVFGDIKRALSEMVRVVRPGGRIVVGDESMAPWLYETEFGRILLNNNPLFQAKVPLEAIPSQAREVTLRWVIGGVYYLIDFTVGEGEPSGQFDLAIPGRRGGTLNTRFYGKLEGVTAATKEMVHQAADKAGKSLHQWLDETLRAAAQQGLNRVGEPKQP